MSSVQPSAAPARRTQAERRDGTRRALLAATVECLVELGYPATTTLEVERRAGVSRGARIHHYPTKATLLAAAVDALYDQLSSHYARAFASGPRRRSARQRVRAGLAALWAIYQQPEFTAVLELNIGARTDAELKLQLRAVAERHRALALETALQLFPTLRAGSAEMLIETIHAAFIGLRTQGGITAQARHTQLVLDALGELAAIHLETRAKQE